MYEDGPHNCESIAIDPRTRTIYLATKHTRESGVIPAIYALDWPASSPTEPLKARRVATLELPSQATAMDIAQDGRRAVILTYQDAYEFVRRRDESWADAFHRSPREIPMPRRLQGETICYGVGSDEQSLYLTSEGRTTTSQPLFMVPVIGRAAYQSTDGTETLIGTIPPDYVDPTVTITAPTDTTIVRGSVSVTYSATDDQDIVAVTLVVDGINVLTADTSIGEFAWDSRTVANGEYAVMVVVRDRDGNEGTAHVQLLVDNTSGPIDVGGVIDSPPTATNETKQDASADNGGGCGSGSGMAALVAALARWLHGRRPWWSSPPPGQRRSAPRRNITERETRQVLPAGRRRTTDGVAVTPG
jgi:hypothetical protein